MLLTIILILNFNSWTIADDVKDFEIEGMSVGDSLLDYFSEEIIKNSYSGAQYPNKEFVIYYFYLSNMKSPKSILLINRSNLLWLNIEIIPTMRKMFNTRFTIVSTSKQKPIYDKIIEKNDSFIASEDLKSQMIQSIKQERQIFKEAKFKIASSFFGFNNITVFKFFSS